MKSIIFACIIMITTNLWANAKLPPHIDWQRGDMVGAMALAKKSERPLFLYWGAVWCPPCNQIKQTIFSSSEFQKTVKAFIPVYMDGDTPEAQVWADKLKTSGYPTMLILSPEGKEIARLPTGVSAQEYGQLMQLALENMRSIADVIKSALAGTATTAEWRRLAGHSWMQDSGINLNEEALRSTLEKLWRQSVGQSDDIRSRLFLQYLVTLAMEEGKSTDSAALFSRQQKKLRQELLATLSPIVASPSLYALNRELLNWSLNDLHAYFKPIATAPSIFEQWLASAKAVADNKQFSLDDRLSAIVPAIQWEEVSNNGTFSKTLQQDVLSKAQWASKTADSDYERQAVMSTAIYAVKSVGLLDEAKTMAQAELAKSKSPYYFMSYLASIEKKQGNKAKAHEWAIKAWEHSQGINSRFQWGVSMLEMLLSDDAESDGKMLERVEQVAAPMLATPEAFNGRNLRRFKALARSLQKWQAKPERQKLAQQKLGVLCTQSKDQATCRATLLAN